MNALLRKALFCAAVYALCGALWLRGEHYAARARTSEALLKSAIAVGNANAQIARDQALLMKKIDGVAALNAIAKRDLRATSDLRRKEITDAPSETDGPLAPVLRDQLNRLPEPSSGDPGRDVAAASDPGVASSAQ